MILIGPTKDLCSFNLEHLQGSFASLRMTWSRNDHGAVSTHTTILPWPRLPQMA